MCKCVFVCVLVHICLCPCVACALACAACVLRISADVYCSHMDPFTRSIHKPANVRAQHMLPAVHVCIVISRVHGIILCAWSFCVHVDFMCALSFRVCMASSCVHCYFMCAWPLFECMVISCVHFHFVCAWSFYVCMARRRLICFGRHVYFLEWTPLRDNPPPKPPF